MMTMKLLYYDEGMCALGVTLSPGFSEFLLEDKDHYFLDISVHGNTHRQYAV